jgi:hypothetical protein
VDENPALADQYKIYAIPAVYVFADGEHVETLIGVNPKENYLQMFEQEKIVYPEIVMLYDILLFMGFSFCIISIMVFCCVSIYLSSHSIIFRML